MTQPTHGLDPNALEAASLAETIKLAALSCGHTITAEEIVLRRSDKRPGNALNQLHQRILAALSQNPGTSNTSGEEAVGVKVKPLEWRKRLGDQIAWSECGVYEVGPTLVGDKLFIANRRTIDKDGSWLDQVLLRSATSLDEAKAAAQADYEHRILAALEPRASDRKAISPEALEALDMVSEITERATAMKLGLAQYPVENIATILAAIRKLSEVSHEH